MSAFMSSSSKSSQVQISSILFFRSFLKVSLRLILMENPMLALDCEWNLFSFMNGKFSRRISKIPATPSCFEPKLSYERVLLDSNLKDKYIRLVTTSVLIFGNIFYTLSLIRWLSYALHEYYRK